MKNASLGERVDYTEAHEISNDNLQKKLAEETNSGENTKILRYILSGSISFVVIFAIFMAIKSQSRKRRKAIIISDEEVLEELKNKEN